MIADLVKFLIGGDVKEFPRSDRRSRPATMNGKTFNVGQVTTKGPQASTGYGDGFYPIGKIGGPRSTSPAHTVPVNSAACRPHPAS